MNLPRAFAGILDYPDAGLHERLGKLIAAIGDADPARRNLEQFLGACANVGSLQELYTATFDLRAECCLYLGYHLFGDQWRRSAWLVQLRQHYRQAGFTEAAELPDHLCVVLRYAADRMNTEEGGDLLAHCVLPCVSRILARMDPANPYAAALQALISIARAAGAREGAA